MATSALDNTLPGQRTALQQLSDREEILQICYWYKGEGFGDTFSAPSLQTFLHCPPDAIEASMQALQASGHLQAVDGGFSFTDKGRQEGARLFADGFSDFQKGSHGECDAGCCDGDDHSQCGDDCALS